MVSKSQVDLRVLDCAPGDIDRWVDVEASHLLLLHLLLTNFDPSSTEYLDLSRNVIEAVRKGGETSWSEQRLLRHELGCRV